LTVAQAEQIIVRLPSPHAHQRVFLDWNVENPDAQCLIAPCGTKVGKTFGASLWMVTEAMTNPGLYCAWIAPTYLKCRIGYRYIKAMLPECDLFQPIDGRLEIRLANGSFIKFLHGRDAETTVEGEAVDRFVIDESGKIQRQVFHSLLTTITQTRGRGICTGTPRGFTWYYDMFKRAQDGDPFFVWAQLRTSQSPYVTEDAVALAERLLPKSLYDQYYNAMFVSAGTVFGDLSGIWDESIPLKPGVIKFWLNPNAELRTGDIVHGIDLARNNDFTVVYSVNAFGQLVGFMRFRQTPYTTQIQRIKRYIHEYFPPATSDNLVRFDATGVGVAVGDLFAEADIDAAITPVTFTNKTKSDMVTRTIMAIESGWHRAPRIPHIEHEFASYELTVTKTGLHSYSAPDGEHDDIVSAAMLAISSAFQSTVAESAERMLENAMNGGTMDENDSDIFAAYANVANGDDGFFDGDGTDDEFHFDEDTA
jgi:hypothetical protein